MFTKHYQDSKILNKTFQDQARMAVVDSQGATGMETVRTILSEPSTLV